MRIPLSLALISLFIPWLGGAVRHQPGLDDPVPQWREGPVRYLLRVDEDARYKRLHTQEERQHFILDFWARLDPDPETEINELRAIFWERVQRANSLFHDIPYFGWKTDRGRLYIILGPPDFRDIQQRTEIWTYRALPGPGAPPEIRFMFAQSRRSGEYVMNPAALRDTHIAPRSYLSLLAMAGSAQTIPGRIVMPQLARGEVRAESFSGLIEATHDFYFYKKADGTTLASLVISATPNQWPAELGSTLPAELELSGTVQDYDTRRVVAHFEGSLIRDLTGDVGPDRSMRFRSSIPLPPGLLDLWITIREAATQRGLTIREVMEVPDFLEERLALSTVAFTRPLETSGWEHSAYTNQRSTVPDPEACYVTGENLLFFYEVYNAGHRDGRPDLDVEYGFFLEGGEKLLRVGSAVRLFQVRGQSLAYVLALTNWPPALYRLRVEVTDMTSGAVASGEKRFRVITTPTEAANCRGDPGKESPSPGRIP